MYEIQIHQTLFFPSSSCTLLPFQTLNDESYLILELQDCSDILLASFLECLIVLKTSKDMRLFFSLQASWNTLKVIFLPVKCIGVAINLLNNFESFSMSTSWFSLYSLLLASLSWLINCFHPSYQSVESIVYMKDQ